MLWGTIMPALRSFHFIKSGKIGLVKYSALLILNMINNFSGFYFYVVKFPSKEISTTINMVANIVFAYYFGYFLLSEYFNSKKKLPETHKGDLKVIYTWESFKTHIGNWNEARSYLLQCLPDLVTYIEQHQLSDLEKTHLCLKKLKITSKEVADIMNVSSRSVETQRYRINKKIELNN